MTEFKKCLLSDLEIERLLNRKLLPDKMRATNDYRTRQKVLKWFDSVADVFLAIDSTKDKRLVASIEDDQLADLEELVELIRSIKSFYKL